MWTTIDTFAMFVLVATVFIIVRWRGWGVLTAIILGYPAIHVIHISFAGDSWHDTEALHDWPVVGLLVMPIWCLLVYGVILIWSRVYRRLRHD